MLGKLNQTNPSGLQEATQRRKLRATDLDHTALLSILRFKEPVLHLLRSVFPVAPPLTG